MTKFNLAVNARLYCSQENRYLADRIVIPADNNPSYLKAIGRLLKSNGCVWMSAERGQADNPFTIDLLGTEATLPKGAPVLAMRHRAALLPAYTTRMGPFRYRLTIAKPIEFDKTLPRALTLEKAANELAVLLSEQILEQPENWCWESSWLRKVTLGDDTAREDEDQITYSGIRRLFGRGRVAKH